MHPPVVRERGGGFTQYWTGGGEVRGRDVTEAALLASGVLDPGTVERAFRDASLGGGAEAAFRAAR